MYIFNSDFGVSVSFSDMVPYCEAVSVCDELCLFFHGSGSLFSGLMSVGDFLFDPDHHWVEHSFDDSVAVPGV